jgi:hypothetical protein
VSKGEKSCDDQVPELHEPAREEAGDADGVDAVAFLNGLGVLESILGNSWGRN